MRNQVPSCLYYNTARSHLLVHSGFQRGTPLSASCGQRPVSLQLWNCPHRRVGVAPSIEVCLECFFVWPKRVLNTQPILKFAFSRMILCTGRANGDGELSLPTRGRYERQCFDAGVCACVRACVRACVCVCVRACVCVCVCSTHFVIAVAMTDAMSANCMSEQQVLVCRILIRLTSGRQVRHGCAHCRIQWRRGRIALPAQPRRSDGCAKPGQPLTSRFPHSYIARALSCVHVACVCTCVLAASFQNATVALLSLTMAVCSAAVTLRRTKRRA